MKLVGGRTVEWISFETGEVLFLIISHFDPFPLLHSAFVTLANKFNAPFTRLHVLITIPYK